MFNPINFISLILLETILILKDKTNYLDSLNILDIGCGGGLISEPMSRLVESNRYRCL